MDVRNIFCLNDWEIQPLLVFILSLMLALWGSINIDTFGISIPLIRQILGFLFLTFIPGLLLLRVLRMHRLGAVRTTVYSVGLSLAVLMSTGFFMNLAYPFFGITRPISLWPIVLTISGVVVVLSALAYFRDRTFSFPECFDTREILSPKVLFLSILPFIAILGAHLVTVNKSNALLVILLVFIGLAVLFLNNNDCPDSLYPFAIFIISISLLYHTSLISTYIVEWADASVEYWTASNVMTESIWDPSIPSNCNAMLSLVILPIFYSTVLNIDLLWIFKAIYPILFSMVPLCIYQIALEQFNKKTAFLSAFFFVSGFAYYTAMLGLNRQQIAELFVVLFLLTMQTKDLLPLNKSILYIIFGFSVVVSHYALAYIFLFLLSLSYGLYFISSFIRLHTPFTSVKNNIYYRKSWLNKIEYGLLRQNNEPISFFLLILYLIFVFVWFFYLSASQPLSSATTIGIHISEAIFINFLNPSASQGLKIIATPSGDIFGMTYKAVYYISQIFIITGFIGSLVSSKNSKVGISYIYFSIGALCIWVAVVFVPFFAATLNIERLYHMTLLILSPFCVKGGEICLNKIESHIKTSSINIHNIVLFILPSFFVLFFLFNSGLIYQFSDHPNSFALNQTSVTSERPYFVEQNYDALVWSESHVSPSYPILADIKSAYLFQAYAGSFDPLTGTSQETLVIPSNAFLYLGSDAIKKNIIWLNDPIHSRIKINPLKVSNIQSFSHAYNLSSVYFNGDSIVFKTPS